VNQTFPEKLLFDPTLEDEAILSSVEEYLADALALKRWWEDAEINHGFQEKFDLERTLNRPASSYGFFGEAPVAGKTMRVMGNVQDMVYDQPKVPAQAVSNGAHWMQQQLREFVLHYFMRVSSFRKPEAFVPDLRPKEDLWLSNLSWCPEPRIAREGFGFTQIYYKTITGEIGRFDTPFAIVDMRDIGTKYAWIVLKVKIFDFSFKLRPFGESGPELVFSLDEESYLVVNEAFILNEEHPEPGVLGRYGIGYGFIKNPAHGLLTYGPGEFDAAFELIQFSAHEDGTLDVHMVFVVNRPAEIANININPLRWTVRAVNLLSLGVASPLLDPIENAMSSFSLGSLDPVATYIFLVNAVTGGYAAEQFCISKTQLDKTFLLQHFMQHYDTVVGSLLTWRQIRNWLDEHELPAWVISGRSS
jgi:hypothetical protein